MPYIIKTEATRGKNTREALTSAKARKGQTRKAGAQLRAQAVDLKHSSTIDKRISNKSQKLAKRAQKRAGLLY